MRSEGEQPEPKIVDVQMSKLRTSLRKHGVAVETHWGQGWRFTEENKAKIRALIEEAA